ncbi:hypothetical protein M422DRAFT_254245 [Sphaerobolus stellatus SS14]|uniref:F-box domain-containing protein n=1 Tax=Sphaerobolus stellatus (strain SS14) TaxID=990650 RepID=A0A0C9VV75_SPHS4|nr:hypothetical protein M422DRAFT_254245 [Sphaerobolus stellatus SS14]
MPCLRRAHGDWGYTTSKSIITLQTPNLISLDAIWIHDILGRFSPDSLHNLLELRVKCITLNTVLKVSRAASNLRKIDLVLCLDLEKSSFSICFPALQSLSIHNREGVIFPTLQCLQVPQIRRLSLRNSDYTRFNTNFDGPKLEILQLNKFTFDPFDEALEGVLFQSMSALRFLYLKFCILPTDFFRRLMQVDRMQHVWPKLEYISLSRTSVSRDDLMSFLVSRTGVMDSDQGLDSSLHMYLDPAEIHFLEEEKMSDSPSDEDQLQHLMEAFPGVFLPVQKEFTDLEDDW